MKAKPSAGPLLSRKQRAVLLCVAGRADRRTSVIAESHCDGRPIRGNDPRFNQSRREQQRRATESARLL